MALDKNNDGRKKKQPETSEYDKAFFSTSNISKSSSLRPDTRQRVDPRDLVSALRPFIMLGLTGIVVACFAYIPLCMLWFKIATAMAEAAYQKADLAGAEAAYKSAALVPLYHDQIITRDKIADLELLQGHYEEGARLLKQQIIAHQVRFEYYFRYNKYHSIDDLGLPYTDISEAEILGNDLGNYEQALAALNRLDQFGPYQRIVWQEVLPACHSDRDRRQIEKNILQHAAGSLWQRGYKAFADRMEAERKQYEGLEPGLKEEKYLDLIYKMVPPKPYDKPVFSRSTLELK